MPRAASVFVIEPDPLARAQIAKILVIGGHRVVGRARYPWQASGLLRSLAERGRDAQVVVVDGNLSADPTMAWDLGKTLPGIQMLAFCGRKPENIATYVNRL